MVRHTRKSKRTLDVRSEKDIPKLNSLLGQSPCTLILIYADWCPHCHDYLPLWEEFANLPGRNANMARVHYDMQEKIPKIATANTDGYPSVIKLLPDGTIESYKKESGETTNALPMIRDKSEMIKNLVISPISANKLFGKNKSAKIKRNFQAFKNKEANAEANAEAAEANAAADVESNAIVTDTKAEAKAAKAEAKAAKAEATAAMAAEAEAKAVEAVEAEAATAT